ncbi:hypothetical protein HYC85_013737 [Camellia sinensis]|uniref:Uncharacterized protein n=1 Tax=Camellia sinensis TaxID=4442 RepID=A0A7J7H485_CAMSI|nr:hypothetical protein HYC85_013737 [Camellia sinensis]
MGKGKRRIGNERGFRCVVVANVRFERWVVDFWGCRQKMAGVDLVMIWRESVRCNNVRALFDELPTPHLVVEITPFLAGPLTEKDYDKAEKLERVIRSSPCV